MNHSLSDNRPASPVRPAAWAPWWVLAFVALWPLPGLAEVVLSLGALLALGQLLWRWRKQAPPQLSPEAWALTTVSFVAYWLPELTSTIDSANPLRSLQEALADIRYLPFLWLAAIAVADGHGRRRVFQGIAFIAGLWVLDGLVQAATGWSLGGPITQDRLSGIFGSDNLKLGIVLASMSPFVLDAAGRRWRLLGWLVAALMLGLVIVLAGARAAWLTYALVLLWMGGRRFGYRRTLVLVTLAGVLGVALAASLSPALHARWERTAAVFSGDRTGLDHALSGRITIWRAAVQMAWEHPINGVGVRGFRNAYPGYREIGDAQFDGGTAFHAHQIVLEVASETGGIGLLLWLAAAAMGVRAWRVASPVARERARVPMTALAVTVFPANTHLAFYSTFWGGVTLLLVALYLGSLLARDDGETDPQPLTDDQS